MCKTVLYFRVSTVRQGVSGLGLEAQEAAVALYCQVARCDVIGRYVEIESGRHNNRPQLAAAIAQCRASKAVLLIAKLDRLGRNVAFIANLMDSGVEFRAVDSPDADRFMLHIRAAVAEDEAHRIGERTRLALQAAKARGRLLGAANPAGGAAAGAAANRAGADARAAGVLPVIAQIRAAGARSLAEIADGLNARGIATARGGKWHATTVKNLVERAA